MKLKTVKSLQSMPVFFAILIACPLPAQVQTDGSVGPIVSLSGNMVISNALGKQVGSNLFQSFSMFNIRTGESALFTSTYSGLTQNVIARVTGSSSSWIDGKLACDIPEANLWLINPKGIAFGKNATLDVQGSFGASTADYVAFADGTRFEAKMPAGSEVLSVANPSGFGFLGPNPMPVNVTGSALRVPNGNILALVGGDISVTNGALRAPGGAIALVSVAGAGEARFDAAAGIDVGSITDFGNISISSKSNLNVSDSLGSGGSIYIRGGRFLLDNSTIQSTTGDDDGGPIDIGVKGDISITNNSRIRTDTYYAGRAGNISLNAAGDIEVSHTSWISSATSGGDGDSGDISISGRNVRISDMGEIYTNTDESAFGNAGNVSVKASDTISISGDPSSFDTGIASNSSQSFGNAGKVSLEAGRFSMNGGAVNTENVLSFGAAGDILVKVSTMDLAGGAILSPSSRGFAPGGKLSIQASESVTLADASSVQSTASYTGSGGSVSISTPVLTVDRSTITTGTYGSGNAGNIDIAVKHLTLTSGFISSEAYPFASGAAGSVSISADNDVLMKNAGSTLDRPRISSSTFGDGNAGSVSISSPRITIDDGVIDTNTLGGRGNAGSIGINTTELVLRNGGSISSDVGQDAAGTGATISVNATGSISISGTSPTLPGFRSGISVGTLGVGNAGSVSLSTPRLDMNGGAITASTAGDGNAGNVSINAGSLSLSNEGNIQVASYGNGSAGSLQVKAGTLTIDGSGTGVYRTGISSEADGNGNGGDVHITADRLDLVNNALISAKSKGSGMAGTLTFDIRDALRLKDSNILTSADLSAGGNIEINVGHMLQLQDSTISSSANGVTSQDSGGNLTVRKPQFLILNASDILARANAGNGGNITLAADYFVQSADSSISASSRQGLDGRIVIDSPNQVAGTVAVLQLPSLNVADLLRERCAAAALRNRGSFTVEGQGGLPPRPGDFLMSPPGTRTTGRKKDSGSRKYGSGSSDAPSDSSQKESNVRGLR
ncbi:MAG TPA: filamentous hemagglutinin N-terminal domain-containing protein [Acidobacteriota bacterium]|nr:filamentous hemagglutinin N-terminal domain-containing protein [Acidobacteriota bacterium]